MQRWRVCGGGIMAIHSRVKDKVRIFAGYLMAENPAEPVLPPVFGVG